MTEPRTPAEDQLMTGYAGWVYRDNDYADEFNGGYAWSTTSNFVEFLLDTLGDTVPLWRSADDTEVAARDVTEVISEQCDTHQTGLLMLGTGNAGLLLLGTYVSADYCAGEAQALSDVLGVPLISREGCS